MLGGAVIAASLWLGWQIVAAVIAQRAPLPLAVRVASASPAVLGRAAEAEYAAGRVDNAYWLSGQGLARAPFDVQSMRTRGLSEAKRGRIALADQLVTLAGNWSLRDDASHGWLIEQRLRRGDYYSAFAHADTLARRREAQRPVIFRLFTTAAMNDARAGPALIRLLGTRPFWRWDYLKSLYAQPETAALQGSLAIALEHTSAPLEPGELEQLYTEWARQGRIEGLKHLRSTLGRPPVEPAVANGSFEDIAVYDPFDWSLATEAGLSSLISADENEKTDQALRVERRTGSGGLVAGQLVLLAPGHYTLSGRARAETNQSPGLRWSLTCFENPAVALGQVPSVATSSWKRFSTSVTVPATGCSAQWLRLYALVDDSPEYRVVWFDDLALTPSH